MDILFSETALDTDAGRLPARVYGAARKTGAVPLVLHLHGGAFTGGTLDCGAMVAAALAAAGAVVVSIDYPLACAHPFPFALTTAFAALTALARGRGAFAAKSSPLYVAGEEAGGNLAAGLAMMARDQQTPHLSGQILLSPMLDPTLATASVRKADAGAPGCKWAEGWRTYLGSADKAAHPYAAPLSSARLAGLPPALVVSAEDDPMRDESVRYAQALRQAGVPATLEILPAPTAWPDGLAAEACATPAWSERLRALFAPFFDITRPRRRNAASAVL